MLLLSCSTTKVATKTKTVQIKPPSPLLQPCELPSSDNIRTNEDIVDAILKWRKAAKECAVSKQRLIEWYDVDILADPH